MNSKYKGSLSKNGKKDKKGKAVASSSSANRQKTSLESVDQQTIIESTNETAKRQVSHPNTRSHSIENILKQQHQGDITKPLNLTRNKLQQGRPKTKKSEVQKQTKLKLSNIQHQQTFADLQMPGPSQIRNSQTTEPLNQNLLQSKEPTPMHPQPYAQLGLLLPPLSKESQTVICLKQHVQQKRKTITFHQQSIPMMELPLHTQSRNSQPGVSLLKKKVMIMEQQQIMRQQTYTELLLVKPNLQSQNLQSTQSHLKQPQPRNMQRTYSRLDVSSQSQNSEISHFRPIPPPNHQVQLPPHEHQEGILSPSQKDHTNTPLLNNSGQLSQSQKLQSSQLHLKQSQPTNQQQKFVQQQTYSHLNVSPQPQNSQKSQFGVILPQEHQETSAHQQESLLQENPSTENSSNHEQLPPYEHQKEYLTPSQKDHTNSPLQNFSGQPSQSQNSLCSQSHLKQPQPMGQQQAVVQQQTQSPLNFSPQPQTSQKSYLKTILPEDCQATSSHQQESLLQENPSTDNLPNQEKPPHEYKKEYIPLFEEDHPNSPLLNIAYQLLHSQSEEEAQINTEDPSSESELPRDLRTLKTSDLTPEIDITLEELLESYLPSRNKN